METTLSDPGSLECQPGVSSAGLLEYAGSRPDHLRPEVRLEHAVDLYRSLPDAELAVVPGTSHGLLVEKPGLCNMVIAEFFTKDPIQTFAPIRRAGPR